MHWTFWFAAKWRGISILLLSIGLLLGLIILRWQGGETLFAQLQLAQSTLRQLQQQHVTAQQQYDLWQAQKSSLQKGGQYMINPSLPTLAGMLQTWQETQPERALRVELEPVELPSDWHTPATKVIHRLQLRFWVHDEADLSNAWRERNALPCMPLMQSAQLFRAEEGGLWVEEEIVCVQF